MDSDAEFLDFRLLSVLLCLYLELIHSRRQMAEVDFVLSRLQCCPLVVVDAV